MELESVVLDMDADTHVVVLNNDDAEELGVHAFDRVSIEKDGEKTIAVVDTTKNMVGKGHIGVTKRLKSWKGDLTVSAAEKPVGVNYIKKKMEGDELEKDEIYELVNEINKNALSDIEMGAYVAAIYSKGMSKNEMAYLTEAMVDAGDKIEWGYDVVADKHSIGGVPGNRVTPIVISIIAAAGLKIPKTSSRAITSPAGTADTMEAVCDVNFSLDEIKEIVEESNGCLVWGGSVKLSPVDDKIIRAEHPLSLDPEGQVIASVLSKKIAAGSNKVVIDIPYGEGAKVNSLDSARALGENFKDIGEMLGLDVECTITIGDEPIGKGVGPALEVIDCIKVLKGVGPKDLRSKSLMLSNILLDMAGHDENAEEILESGRALEKFREIVRLQNGPEKISEEDISLGEFSEDVVAEKSGVVKNIGNRRLSELGSLTGAPKDKGAGIYLHKRKGDSVKEGERLMTVYAERKEKLDKVLDACKKNNSFRLMDENELLVEEF